ncbi:MAG: hypothetical protein QF570_19480 [Myxococcota bacterium]|jgi:hypothetical protein|nr:hypothetical protein [Myxococcota bacterium]
MTRALLLALLLLSLSVPAHATVEWTIEPAYLVPEWPTRASVALAFDFSRGKYESEESSDTLSLQPAVRVESDNFAVRAALPFYRLEGPIEAGSAAPTETEWGVGDLTLDFTYTLYPIVRGGPFLDFMTRIKVPTAEDLFGTGDTDVTLQLSAYQMLGFDVAALGDFGIRMRSGGLYRDTLQAAFILGSQKPGSVGIWLAYDWRESPLPSLRSDEHELTPFISIPFGEKLRVEPYGVIGLSEGSPDWGLGGSISWRF